MNNIISTQSQTKKSEKKPEFKSFYSQINLNREQILMELERNKSIIEVAQRNLDYLEGELRQ